MELTNEFRVAVAVEEAWPLLTDIERIAPCLPGATLEEVAGEEYRGVVKVKVGPITTSYRGTATIVSRDETRHEAVIRAEGRETRGQGNAVATVTLTLIADGDATAGRVVTEVNVSGRVAQLGRGALSDVAAKLIGEFVDCLERDVLAASRVRVASEGASASRSRDERLTPGGERSAPREERSVSPKEPLDLLELAGPSLARRLAPAAVAGLAAAVLLARRRRRRSL